MDYLKLENELDMKCDRYNKFTQNNPAKYISYDKRENRYTYENNNCKIKRKTLKDLIFIVKDEFVRYMATLCDKKYVKLVNLQFHKNYDDKLVSYLHNGIELFDIHHIIQFLHYGKPRAKYDSSQKYIKFNSIKDNVVGGFYVKEYVERNDLKHILADSRKVKMTLLFDLIKEPLISKLPIQTETLKIIGEIFEDYEPIHNHTVGKYYVDLYLKKAKIVIECDEKGHAHYDQEKEKVREQFIRDKLKCTIYRFNPDDKQFNINYVARDILRLMNI